MPIVIRSATHETKPKWGHGKAHLELMSPFYLRSTLSLNDVDEVAVQVEDDDDWLEFRLMRWVRI